MAPRIVFALVILLLLVSAIRPHYANSQVPTTTSPSPSAVGTQQTTSSAATEVVISSTTRIIVMVLSVAAMLGISAALLTGQLYGLVLGQDNRYSNSKFQMAAWFGILIASYIATFYMRWQYGEGASVGGINIPPDLAAVSGISALTLGGAKAITTSKHNAAVAAGDTGKVSGRDPSFPFDLFHSDKPAHNPAVDFGDFQMVIVTMLAIVTYIVQIFYFLGTTASFLPSLGKPVSLPDVDLTILATFGLGQGAYLTKKYAGNPGES